MTECAQCGNCCDPVFLVGGMVETVVTGRSKQAGWLRRHWRFLRYTSLGGGSLGAQFECDKFDPETRQCTAHDERPDVCRGYPWYRSESRWLDPTMGPVCSYVADVPGRLLPIVAIT